MWHIAFVLIGKLFPLTRRILNSELKKINTFQLQIENIFMPVEKSHLWGRITEALGTEKVSEIQAKLKETVKTVQAVYKWQDGNPPSLETVVLISDLTGSSIHWLLTGEGEQYPTGRRRKELPLESEERDAVKEIAKSAEDSFEATIAMIVREWLFERGQLTSIEDKEILAPIYAMKEDLPQEKRHEIIGRMIERTLKIAAA